MDKGVLRFGPQVEIEAEGSSPFSQRGDSGSPIVDHEVRGVGLLFAPGEQCGSIGLGPT